MKIDRIMMGMPIIVEIIGEDNKVQSVINDVFDYFDYIDKTFSVYKENSEISKINRGEILPQKYSNDMREIFELAEKTKLETNGYFDINNGKIVDPSGIVKGWAIYKAGQLIRQKGFQNFYVNAGGDIELGGHNSQGKKWKVGLVNPFDTKTSIKTLYLSDCGVATSGNYERGNHIYNPKDGKNVEKMGNNIVSLTVIGQNVLEADRFSTPAFAMGKMGIDFIQKQNNLEGYIIDNNGIATMTSSFNKYTSENN